jgi:hypothetical protein
MSEAEVHILRSRMEQGRRNKARRGELLSHMPIGYQILPSGEVATDPDEQARDVVHLVFDKFDELGSVAGVVRHLQGHDIRLGVRPTSGSNRGQLEWRHASRITVRNMLRHPIYAGAYCYRRNAVDPRLKTPGRKKSGCRALPREEWLALHRDRLPPYITWEQYERNLEQLARNRTRCLGVPRVGPSLLAGLAYCGRCGRRMRVISGKPQRPRYHCLREGEGFPPPTCQGLMAGPLDEMVGRQVLAILEPAALELSLKAAEDVLQERQRLHGHWRQRLERARYDAERAARQYHAAEPENRLVARELEARWEQALRARRQLQEEYDRFQCDAPEHLSEEDRAAIRALAWDLPALWQEATTSVTDRQAIIRHLVDRVAVQVQDDSEYVDVSIHWVGGFVSHHEITRPVGRLEQLRDFATLMERVRALQAAGESSTRIAARLNDEGFRSPRSRAAFTGSYVRQLLRRHRIALGRLHADGRPPLDVDEWWPVDLARELGMPGPTLLSWRSRGWVVGRQLPGVKGRWVIWADADEVGRLGRLRACPRGWPDEPYPRELTTPKGRGHG